MRALCAITMNWTEFEIFKGVDLQDSFVLGWSNTDSRLEFQLEASIWPESEFYTNPKSGEHTCYRPATIAFVNTSSVQGLAQIGSVKYSTDPDGSKDYGNIESLSKTPEGFIVSGEFGNVSIKGGTLEFSIST